MHMQLAKKSLECFDNVPKSKQNISSPTFPFLSDTKLYFFKKIHRLKVGNVL